MRNREPFHLRRFLFLWNIALCSFSILSAAAVLPSLFGDIAKHGLAGSMCYTETFIVSHRSLWMFLFTLSKAVELFDTFFIVARKTPLIFLHWYHHITTMIFCFYFVGRPMATGHWFAAMNVIVHSIMYLHYAIRAYGIRLPTWTSQIVTVLQLLQMLVGIVCNLVAIRVVMRGEPCMMNWNAFNLAMIMYGSYAVLFLNFFIHRYCCKKGLKDRHKTD